MNVRTFSKISVILCVAFAVSSDVQARLSSLASNDPFPMYSTHHPYDYLYARERANMRGRKHEEAQRLSFAISPFLQKAKIGKNRFSERVELGDINGRWNMVGLLYGGTPCDQSRGTTLEAAMDEQFCTPPTHCQTYDDAYLCNPDYTDTNQRFGFFSVPLEYRKAGARFEMIGMLSDCFGVNIGFGVADITQVLQTECKDRLISCECVNDSNVVDACSTGASCNILTEGKRGLINLTDIACDGPKTSTGTLFSDADNQGLVDNLLMSKYKPIFQEMGLNICDYHESSVEDLQVSLFWRHAFELNKKHSARYPKFLFVPFITVDGSLGLGKEKNPAMAFALPFGNNGHHAAGFSTGFTLDFYDTIEIGIEAGTTHFFKKDFCNVFVPTHEYQSGIFPFKTDICVKPGTNWHFSALMSAYHYMDKLSFHAQYVYVTHEENKIHLLHPNIGDPASTNCYDDSCDSSDDGIFKPERLAQDSAWSSHVANLAFNYDISPYTTIGFLWQVPITRRAAYRSNMVMGSFEARF